MTRPAAGLIDNHVSAARVHDEVLEQV